MRKFESVLLLAVAAGLAGFGAYCTVTGVDAVSSPSAAPAPAPCPDDRCPVPAPGPKPPKPKPWVKRDGIFRPALGLGAISAKPFGAKVTGPVFDDGTQLDCDFPGDHHRRNTASKGLGLCVFTSIHHAADWQDIPALLEMPKWMISKGIAGGGYPAKVAKLIPQLCQERGMPVPDYLQVESNDLSVLKAACAGGRMPCVTYAVSPTKRYGGQHIAHMVNLVHMDDRHAVVLDNNYPGYGAFEWMTHAEFLRAYSGGGTGWAVIFLDPGPPPPPHNGTPAPRPPADAFPAPTPDDDSDRYKWVPWSRHQTALHDRGVEVGLWDSREKAYYEKRPDGCFHLAEKGPPCLTPEARHAGVVAGKIGEGPRYYHGEYEVTRDDVMLALASVPDDARKAVVTVIGPAEARKPVEADWKAAPDLAALRGEFRFKAYDPSHWHVAKYGFVTTGRPTIYVQDPTGKVLARQDSYAGPAHLAQTLRRARPDYDPKKDSPTPGGGGVPLGPIAIVAGAGAGAYWLARQRAR